MSMLHTLMSSSSLSQVTSGLGLPRVTQGNTALDSTRRVTLVGWRLICGSNVETDKRQDLMVLAFYLNAVGNLSFLSVRFRP